MDANHGLSTAKNAGGLLAVPYEYSAWTTTQRHQEQKQRVTGEPDTWKLVSPVRGGGVEKGHFVYLVGVLLYHMAHEERQDGCHSPAEVLGWIKGMQPEEAVVHEAFSAICETRRLDKAGYAKFRNWSLYGERALAGEITQVNIFQDFLTLEYEQEKLSRYSVEWQLDERHLARVGNPRFYRHPYQSPQQELWQLGEVEWFVIIRNAPPVRRRKRKSRLVVIQLPLLLDGTEE
jgi:hypothetical protein